MTNQKQEPVFEQRHRQIRASVFKNFTKDGKPFYNTQLVRRYNANGEWRSSSHFTGEEDLVLAKSLIEKVLRFIENNKPTEKEQLF